MRGEGLTRRIVFDSFDSLNGLRFAMARRRIGQERLGFVVGGSGRHSCLAERVRLIDWVPVEHQLAVISCAAKGEPAWPPLALFKAMLIAVCYDLSAVELDDLASFRRFCGFLASEPTPEAHGLCSFPQGPYGPWAGQVAV